MSDEPFGRQPQPVRVMLIGESIDVDYWLRVLMQRAEFKGDLTQSVGSATFVIYPRAVND